MVYDVNNNSKSDHTGELSPFVSESKLTLSKVSIVGDLLGSKWYNLFVIISLPMSVMISIDKDCPFCGKESIMSVVVTDCRST